MAKKSQIQKFRDKARELEADESEAAFAASLREIAGRKATEKRAKTASRKKRG